jgi:hypothetical protein
MNTLARSWELAKASFNVLRSDKELALFPIVSMLGLIVVTIVFAIPLFATGLLDSLSNGDGVNVLTLIVVFLFYVVSYTVIFFANSALVGAALIRLNGSDPSLGDGFRIASGKIGNIVGYALIAATVGMILQAIRDRSNVLGQIVVSIIGGAWNLVTFLVVPVLVNEDVGPLQAIQRSFDLLKRTWGEQVVGNFGIGTIFGLLFMGVIILGGGLVALVANISSALAIAAGIVLVILLIGLGVLSSTLNGIFTAALYRYATEGDAGSFFDPGLVQSAFRQK